MAKLDEMLRSVGLHQLAKPEVHPVTDDTGDEQAIPLDTAFLTDRPSRILSGPRGRDPGGYPKVIPAGMPPAAFGEPKRLMLPKDMEIPPRPSEYKEFLNIAGAFSGELINEYIGFPAGTIQLDNYTTCWVLLDAAKKFIPPLTMGWQIPIWKKVTSLRLVASPPGGQTQPSFSAGGVVYAFAIEARLAPATGFTA